MTFRFGHSLTFLALLAIASAFGCARQSSLSTPPPALTAPDSFQVAVQTSSGPVQLMIHRAWAPQGADRFYSLLRQRYFDDAKIYRVVPNFVAQFGLAANPKVTARYKALTIPDDPVRHSNSRGTVSFARSKQPNSRTTQLFFNLIDNPRLDTLDTFGFPPIGLVIQGMAAVDSFTAVYNGKMPRDVQDSINAMGNAYLMKNFPKLDFIESMKIVKEWK